jgi:hypothetical protein
MFDRPAAWDTERAVAAGEHSNSNCLAGLSETFWGPATIHVKSATLTPEPRFRTADAPAASVAF